jgi:hypothetical protein
VRRRQPRGFAIAGVGLALAFAAPGCSSQVGTFLPHLVNGTTSYSTSDQIAEAKALGVRIQRIHQVVGQALSSDVQAFANNGIQTQLTIKATAGKQTQPIDTPEAQAAFRTGLSSLLDQYKPPLLSVENEPTADIFYGGTADQYLTELRIAVDVARAHNVAITDGGIPGGTIALVAWNHIRTTRGTTAADAYLNTVFRGASGVWVVGDLTGVAANDPDPYSHLSRAAPRQNWIDAEYLLSQYGTDPGDVPLTYVNFHWYVLDDVGGYKTTGYTDAEALTDTIDAIKEITGRPVVTNEIGQHGTTPEAVSGTLHVVLDQENLLYVIWFDADGIPAHGLFDPALGVGHLRPSGETFRDTLVTYYSTQH